MTTSADVARTAATALAPHVIGGELQVEVRLVLRRDGALSIRDAGTLHVALASGCGAFARAGRVGAALRSSGLRARPPAVDLDSAGARLRVPVDWDVTP